MQRVHEDARAVQLNLTGTPWEPPVPTDPAAVDVLSVLRDGQVHTRSDLSRRTGLTDRAVRAAVARLRLTGHVVVAISAAPGGYSLSDDPLERQALLHELESRAKSLLRTRSALLRSAARMAA